MGQRGAPARASSGFKEAVYSGIAPRVGIRETRRIVGDAVLTAEDVLSARKRDDGVAKGCHHIDLHGAGREQLRKFIPDGGSYDIPFGVLIANLGPWYNSGSNHRPAS